MRLPVTLWQAGTDPDSLESLSGAGIGDLCIAGRFRLLEQGRAPIGLAVGVPLTVPTGNEGGWLGEAGPSFSPQVTVDRRAGRLRVAGTLGARLRAPEQVGTVTLGPELLYRAGLAVDLARGLTVATEVAGAVGGAADNSPLEWLTTLAWTHPRGVEAAAGAGFGVLPGFGTPDVRIYARVAWNVPVGRRPASPRAPVVLEEGAEGAEVAATAVALVKERRLLLADAVRFDVGRSAIEASFRPALLAVARWLGAHPEVARLRIEGHADHVGTDAYNLDLSRRRASAVREFLVREGRVDPLRLEARAFGEGRPAASNGTEEGRAVNRRVEFFASAPPPEPAPTAHAGDDGGG
ncbi:OmpA family protein [Myxococcota bacterium]|nr:OmpA family protein [Myxococcota bacterium]